MNADSALVEPGFLDSIDDCIICVDVVVCSVTDFVLLIVERGELNHGQAPVIEIVLDRQHDR